MPPDPGVTWCPSCSGGSVRRRYPVGGPTADQLKASNRGKYGKRTWVGVDNVYFVDVVPYPPWILVEHWYPVWFTKGSDGSAASVDLQLGGAMKRREKKREELQTRAFHDEEFREQYPTLFDHLSALTFDGEGGGDRVVSTLLVFGKDGGLTACLRDRNDSVCCWVSGRTLRDVLTVLERDLAEDTAVWRLDRSAGHPTAARKPKPKSP